MLFRRINTRRLITTLLCAGLTGCGAAIDDQGTGDEVTGNLVSLTAETTIRNGQQIPAVDNSKATDSLYDDEPLVPAIVLDGESVSKFEPIVGPGPTIPVSVGLHTGLLAPDFTADPTAAFHPHGPQVCASGCAASNHATPELKRPAFNRLLATYQRGPLDETNAALESLLFYGRQSDLFLKSTEVSSSEHGAFLRQQLQKTHALLSFRVVDEEGIVRVEMKQTRVPLDRRHVFDMETHNIQPLVTSGTVKRVGLHHLWTRL